MRIVADIQTWRKPFKIKALRIVVKFHTILVIIYRDNWLQLCIIRRQFRKFRIAKCCFLARFFAYSREIVPVILV